VYAQECGLADSAAVMTNQAFTVEVEQHPADTPAGEPGSRIARCPDLALLNLWGRSKVPE